MVPTGFCVNFRLFSDNAHTRKYIFSYVRERKRQLRSKIASNSLGHESSSYHFKFTSRFYQVWSRSSDRAKLISVLSRTSRLTIFPICQSVRVRDVFIVTWNEQRLLRRRSLVHIVSAKLFVTFRRTSPSAVSSSSRSAISPRNSILTRLLTISLSRLVLLWPRDRVLRSTRRNEKSVTAK